MRSGTIEASIYLHHYDSWIAITHALTYEVAFALTGSIARFDSARDRSQTRCRSIAAPKRQGAKSLNQ